MLTNPWTVISKFYLASRIFFIFTNAFLYINWIKNILLCNEKQGHKKHLCQGYTMTLVSQHHLLSSCATESG